MSITLNNQTGSEKYVPVDAPLGKNDASKYQMVEDLFTNHGYICVDDENGVKYGKLSFHDMITSGDLKRFVPKVVTYMLRGGIEPRMVIAKSLFKNVQVDDQIQVDIGYFGPLEAYEQPEGRDWKESQISFGNGDMIQPIIYRRIGVQFRITDSAKRLGGYDVIRLMISEAGKALVRYKEKRCMDAIEVAGITLYDNTSADEGVLGRTTGRNQTTAYNGTMSLNDLMSSYAFMQMRNFNPNIMLMNPMGWMAFATSPDTREIVTNGNVVTSSPLPDGSGSMAPENPFMPFGLNTNSGTGTSTPDSIFGKIGYNPFVSTLNPLNATFSASTKFFPGGLTIVTSPFVRYTTNAGAVAANSGLPSTDIYLADSERTGIIVTSDMPGMKTYDDFLSESSFFRLGETYAVEITHQGNGIGVSKGIIVDRNYVFENVNSQTISDIDPNDTTLATA